MQGDRKLSWNLARWKWDKVSVHTATTFHFYLLLGISYEVFLCWRLLTKSKGVLCLIFELCPKPQDIIYILKTKKTKRGYWWCNTCILLSHCVTSLHLFWLAWMKIPHLKLWHYIMHYLWLSLSLSRKLFLPLVFLLLI